MMNNMNWLRQKGSKNESRVSFVELFFDLVFVYSISQLAHTLAGHFTWYGVIETGLLLFAVWWVWTFTAWVTNWLDPDRMPVRVMLFCLMFVGLVLSASIPEAFEGRGLSFAVAYVLMQVGRSLFTVYALKDAGPVRHRNFIRISCWLIVAGVFWIAGGVAEGEARLALWVVALLIEYAGPAAGFRVPGLGHSAAEDWDISGAHMAERCALFIIICLGETILEAGEAFAELPTGVTTLTILLTVFVGTIAMWWIYFRFGHERAAHRIEHAETPGRLARQAFTYAHIPILAGIILNVVGNKLLFEAPHEAVEPASVAAVLGGPLLFLVGNLWFKGATSGRPPLSHMVGIAALLVAWPLAFAFDVYGLGALATAILVVVAVWEFVSLTRPASPGQSSKAH